MSTSPRPELAAVPACPHGSLGDAEREGCGLAAAVDFSVNGNPLGAPPEVAAAVAAAEPTRYPDDGCLHLRRALAERAGVAPERVLVGNGSIEIIWLLASAYLRPGDNVLIVGPTFGEYARAAAIQGAAKTVEYSPSAASGFRPDVGEVLALARRLRPRLLFVCNPNNPTGAYLGRDAVRRLLAGCEDGLLVVDEAYLSFVDGAESLTGLLDEGIVLLRSMTKDYALAGLRLGYALAAPEVIQALATVRPPWSVNAPAQAAGLAVLGPAGEAHLRRSRAAVAEAKLYLREALASLGLEVMPSATNLLLVRVGEANAFRAALLARGYCVRDCTSFGLPDYIRIGMRPLPECRGLVAAVREVLGGG